MDRLRLGMQYKQTEGVSKFARRYLPSETELRESSCGAITTYLGNLLLVIVVFFFSNGVLNFIFIII